MVAVAARKFAEARKGLAQLFPQIPVEKLSSLADIFAPEEPAAQVSNAGRLGVQRKRKSNPHQVASTAPSLMQAITVILKEKGSADAGTILGELEARKWLPDSKNPRQYITQTLSSHKDDFCRVSPGTYGLIPKTQEEAPKAPESAPAPAQSSTQVSKPSKNREHKEVDPTLSLRVGKLLQTTTRSNTIHDLTKAAKASNYRSIHFLMLNLEKSGVVKRDTQKSLAGHILWQVADREKLADFVQRHES
jgi:hypothetical protein